MQNLIPEVTRLFLSLKQFKVSSEDRCRHTKKYKQSPTVVVDHRVSEHRNVEEDGVAKAALVRGRKGLWRR